MSRVPAVLSAVVCVVVLFVNACSTRTDVKSTTSSMPTATTMPGTVASASSSTSEAPASSTSVPASTIAPTTDAPTTVVSATPAPPPPVAVVAAVPLRLEQVADLDEVVGLAWRPGDPAVYFATQHGYVHRLLDGVLTLTLNLSADTTPVLDGSERGLLGVAFDPRDGRLFVNFTGRDNHTRVQSFDIDSGVSPLLSRREVLFVEQPGVGHNGGRLVFGADGHLFIGLGDGGGSNGRDAQDTTKLLGAILRVLPRLDGDGYDIPPDNPFADGATDRAEVWARGFRNPWMFSIDEPTGNMWIGDVGNDSIEEIDLIPAGQSGLNFGWYYFEGSKQRYASVPGGMTPPVYEYTRSMGNAVMGGYVYRGAAIPALDGAYVFGDVSGAVYALGADGAVPLAVDDLGYLLGFGADQAGELYLFGMFTGVYRLIPG